MSRRTRRRLTNAARVVAPVAIGFAVPGIGTAIAGSMGVTSALGTAAVTAGTGAVLGGAASRATGGDFRTGAILGGVGGAASGLTAARAAQAASSGAAQATPQWVTQAVTGGATDAATARAMGADTSDALRAGFAGAAGSAAMSGGRAAFGAARDAFTPTLQAAPVQGGLDLGTATTLPTTQGVGVPTTAPAAATGSQSLLAAGAGTPTIGAGSTAGTPALDLRQAMSAQPVINQQAAGAGTPTIGAVASRAIGQAPTGTMMAGGPGAEFGFSGTPTAPTPDVRTMNVVTNRGAEVGGTMPLQTAAPLQLPVTAQQVMSAQPVINQQATQSPFGTIGSSGQPIQLSTTPTPATSSTPTVGTAAEPDRGVVGNLWDRFTDGERWADFAVMAGGQAISSLLMSPDDLEFDPNEFEQAMPDFGGFDISEIQGQLSPEEQELYQLMLEDMQRLAEQDQELFLERMRLARDMIGEANYFDPEYWGSRAMARTRVAAGRAAREAERERALTGRGPSAADRRQREIDAALAGQTAYTDAADTAGGRRLSTMQQAAGLMPSSAPARMDTTGLVGLSQTGFDRMQQDFQNQLSAAQQFDASRGSAFDIFSREQDRRDQRAAAAQQGLGGLLEPFMSTS